MSDLLDDYQKIKAELRELSKQIFELYSNNDILGVLRSRNIDRIEIMENRQNPLYVDLEFVSFKEDIIVFVISVERSDVLEFNENKLLDTWFDEIIKMIEKNNIMTSKKFMKMFPKTDYPLLTSIITNSLNGTFKNKTDDEIAVLVSKHITKLLEKMVQEKRNEIK